MKNLLAILLFFSVGAYAAEASNVNEYSWTAKSATTALSGNDKTYLVNKAFGQVQKQLDAKAKAKEVPDGTSFEVVIIWKNKEFKRKMTAHKAYPVEIPRGSLPRR